MQDQRFGMNQGCVPCGDVKPARTVNEGIAQGESDADFALLLLDMVKDVIRENEASFVVRPPLFPPLVDAPSHEPEDYLDEYFMDDFDDLCAPPARQPVHNRPRVSCDEVPAQEIEWKSQYGNRDAFYSTRQLAKLTHRSISRVRRWVKEGKIVAVRLGGEGSKSQMFIPKDQLGRLRALGIGEIG